MDIPGDTIASIFAMVLATAGLFLPAIIAKCRNHCNKGAIFVLTLLGGWTLIGWVIAMVWAMMRSPARKGYRDYPESKAGQFFEQSIRNLVQEARPPELAGRDVEDEIGCMTALAVHNFRWLYEGKNDAIDAMTMDQFLVLDVAISTAIYSTRIWQLQHPTAA